MSKRAVVASLLVISVAACIWLAVRSVGSSATASLAPPAVLTVDRSHPGALFRSGAVGLSLEVKELGTGQLTAARQPLVRLMRLLGPSVLRIGGNTADFSWWTSSGEAPPAWAMSTITPSNLAALHTLLRATGWRVLLGVDLGHFEPARVADEARNAQRILGGGLLGVEIGNEPNYYGHKPFDLRPPTYSPESYFGEAAAYDQALRAAVPRLALYGPALGRTGPWLKQLGSGAHIFSELTEHYYPTSVCPSTPPSRAQPTAAGLLSPPVRQEEDEMLTALRRAGSAAGRPERIGETNSVSCGLNASASPVFASALWALDWSLRAASSGVRGLNFHGGLGACGLHSQSPICAPSEAAALAGVVAAAPEFYGLLAARLLEGGRFVPTHLKAPAPLPDLTTWATLAHNGTIAIAIDDLATAGQAQPVLIPVSGYAATVQSLAGSAIEAKVGITLGRAPVAGGGGWQPIPTRVSHQRTLRIVVRPASAAIVTLRPTLPASRRSHG